MSPWPARVPPSLVAPACQRQPHLAKIPIQNPHSIARPHCGAGESHMAKATHIGESSSSSPPDKITPAFRER